MEQARENKSVRAVPEGHHTVTPYLVADNAQGLLDFIQNAFNGNITFVTKTGDGKIMHATVTIGDSIVMVADTMEGMEAHTAMLYLYLEDVDKVFKQAVQAKGTPVREPVTEFYGDRAGAVKDQWGNLWWIATHVEDVDPDQLERRTAEMMKEQKQRSGEVHA
ncbi:MAG TPA: VOC family protein [Chryseosolibacter sp.]|nr:VOC family protein [Chryseosolibacter sp.]